eukprot:7188985-Alexandrium_andersonii.AAC.1
MTDRERSPRRSYSPRPELPEQARRASEHGVTRFAPAQNTPAPGHGYIADANLREAVWWEMHATQGQCCPLRPTM